MGRVCRTEYGEKKEKQRSAEGSPVVFSRVVVTVYIPKSYLGKELPKGLEGIVVSVHIGSGIVTVFISE